MKLQRNTLILVATALVLGAGVSLSEMPWTQPQPSGSSKEGAGQKVILSFLENDVVGLKVERPDDTLVLERDKNQDWKLTVPLQEPAEPGSVAFLLSRLNTDAPLQTLAMEADKAEEFGFTRPTGTVTVTLANGNQHRLILGGPDFSGTAYYAVVDPPQWPPNHGNPAYKVLVVSADVANGINRPLPEWKMAAEKSTPSSMATPGEPAIPDIRDSRKDLGN